MKGTAGNGNTAILWHVSVVIHYLGYIVLLFTNVDMPYAMPVDSNSRPCAGHAHGPPVLACGSASEDFNKFR